MQFHPLTITGEIDDSESLIVQGGGSDEIVVCAWDGMTYIVDQQRNSVRFQFEQNVSAFTAGTMVNYYAEREGRKGDQRERRGEGGRGGQGEREGGQGGREREGGGRGGQGEREGGGEREG